MPKICTFNVITKEATEGTVEYESATPVPLTPEQIDALRQAAYQAEADPLFFKYQRSEATREEWLAKVEEIRARYP